MDSSTVLTATVPAFGHWVIEHATQGMIWSDEGMGLMGRSRLQAFATVEDFLASVPAHDRSLLTDAITNSTTTGKACSIEHQIVWPDDSIRWIQETCIPVADDSGKVTRTHGIAIDRTEEHAASTGSGPALKLHSSIFLNMIDGLALVEIASRRIVAVNLAFARMCGGEISEITERPMLDLHPDTARPLIEEALSAHARSETPLTHRVPFRSFDGMIWYGEVRSRSLEIDGRRYVLGLIRNLGSMPDEPSREQIFNSLLETTSEAVVVTDAANRILTTNSAFERITGYAREEAVGRNPSFLSSGRQQAAFYQSLWKSVLENGTWSGEIWNRRKNGEIYPEWLNISVLRDANRQIINHIAVFSDITKQKKVEADHISLTMRDWLTQLPNRLSFVQSLQDALAQAKRSGRSVGVLMADIRNFSRVNESYGYEIGDEILIILARRLKEIGQQGEIVSRHDSDEFAILLPDIPSAESCITAMSQVKAQMEAPISIAGREIKLGANVGAAVYPNDSAEPLELMNAAISALRESRNKQGQGFCFYSSGMDARARRHLLVETRLRSTLESGQIAAHYQPQLDLKTNQLVGFEALARWNDPELGVIAPNEFINVAVDGDLMHRLGEAVLDRVLADILNWRKAGLDVPKVAVNFTPGELQTDGFAAYVISKLAAAGLDSSQIELEVTESAILEPSRTARENFLALRSAGVSLSIDDFGTGYSSFAYLRNFAFDKIKIDQVFIRGIGHNPNDDAIVRALVALAAALRIATIAEGVETTEQAEFLRDAGCQMSQGWLHGRAEPPEQAMLRLPRLADRA